VSYFHAALHEGADDSALDMITVRMEDETIAKLERLGGPDVLIARSKEAHSRALKRLTKRDEGHRAALSTIRQQAVLDAQGAWNKGDAYFALVLFQTLKRDEGGWELAIQEIAATGWRLDSWRVIGPAPSPFGSAVTLILTLFTRGS
jgi:hypothetical protein